MITAAHLKKWFGYHSNTDAESSKIDTVRDAGHGFAKIILECTPPGADQSVAVRHVREAVANAVEGITRG